MDSYDPNNSAAMENDNQMEIEETESYDDYGFESDQMGQEDSSWRVRRASIHMINTLIKSRNDLVSDLSKGVVQTLVSRLKEKDENVRHDIFSSLESYYRASVSSPGDLESTMELPRMVRIKSDVENQEQINALLVDEVAKKTFSE